MSDPSIEVSIDELAVEVQYAGPQGPAGAAGPQNLFVQQTQPVFTGPGLWFEVDGAGLPVTLWINA